MIISEHNYLKELINNEYWHRMRTEVLPFHDSIMSALDNNDVAQAKEIMSKRDNLENQINHWQQQRLDFVDLLEANPLL